MQAFRALLVAIVLGVGLAGAGPAFAVQPDEVLADQVLETRARDISAELRCLICQNQSIDDSASPFAREIRLLLRERLTAGDTDAEIREFMVARYGEEILLRPPFSARTAVLWLAPAGLLIAGGILAFVVIRRRSRSKDPGDLSAEEERQLQRLMDRPGDIKN